MHLVVIAVLGMENGEKRHLKNLSLFKEITKKHIEEKGLGRTDSLALVPSPPSNFLGFNEENSLKIFIHIV